MQRPVVAVLACSVGAALSGCREGPDGKPPVAPEPPRASVVVPSATAAPIPAPAPSASGEGGGGGEAPVQPCAWWCP
jgi:hypothetical protein